MSSRRLRFLHLTTFYPPYSFGGDAMYLYRLAHALGELGHHVDVAHCVDSYHILHPGEPEIAFAEHPNVHRHELRSGFGWVSPLLTHQTGRPYLKRKRIRELLDSTRYDVIHHHNTTLLGPAVLAMEPSRGSAVKIYTTHEHWLICPTHVLLKYNKRPCEKPACFGCALAAKRPPQLWRYTGMLKRAGRHIDQFVSPSRFTARMHAERGFPFPVGHLPYFADRVDRDWRSPGPRPDEKPYFLFVGRLEYLKGLHTLIDLWNRNPQRLGGAYNLLIAGTGTHETELRRQAAGNANIKFLGALPQSELGNLYYHALAAVVPSITYETFGIVCIEAFARQTPVIARDLGALPEVVQDSGGGFVYRTDEELMNSLESVAKSPRLRSELGERAYESFVRWWSQEAHLKTYFEYLRRSAAAKFGSVPWEFKDRSVAESIARTA